ncbi:enoyl-CoA hydratase/isomerase family protein [Gammaproteobacteria bacterium AB-CW1]|uniref:Enoyl-CoA hydratase/isomerase family protein n=2 Tax=Natronospira TaxID=2024969 RepID=A0AAP6JE63_9GAMM|nr:enoyl-CoA hydratase/isomerase family protein [Gammaproteobacteria bacterium AB-CW1]
MTEQVKVNIDAQGVATVTLNRPEKHNAFNQDVIQELTATFSKLNNDDSVRVVVLTGEGKSFSAGADLNWMRSMAEYSEDENLEDSLRLAELMWTLDGLQKPTVARINGSVFGGGVGLVACCDIAVSVAEAKFALTEVRLGLVPAVISPFVIRAIGTRQARRFFMTGEAMDAELAEKVNLVHEVVAADQLDEAVTVHVKRLLKGGPNALRASKELIDSIHGQGISAREAAKMKTSRLIAQLRVSEEGQEGLSAFLEKRAPNWVGK